ncbi:MAG TPA: hypothetical protein VLE53_02025 [Gemmatimonadaceae bacterium]|nr:hypothetical protein [Gemmatimonadaceae bacterium]
MVRTAAKALAGIALVPGLLAAQTAQPAQTASNFNDSWFWGINGGVYMFTAGAGSDVSVTAPSVGAEWLITRTRIALRLSIQQAFFDEQGGLVDSTVPGGVRPVSVSDWRRYSAEMFFIPAVYGDLRPYGGIGLSLNVLRDAFPAGGFSSQSASDSAFGLVAERGTRAALVFTGGAQWNVGRAGLFFQGSAMPTRNRFLFNRSHYSFLLEAGLRYNFGTAIEKFID